MKGGRVRDAHEPEPKCLASTGELIDIERVTISSEGDRWKSTCKGTSLAVYPTSRPVLRRGDGSNPGSLAGFVGLAEDVGLRYPVTQHSTREMLDEVA